MGAAGTKQGESGVPYKQGQLKFDEIFEETIDTETKERHEKAKRQAFCEQCFIDGFMNVAFYMCIVCDKYYCNKCFKRHNKRNKSHTVVRVKSKSRQNDGFNDFISVMMNESDKERKESLRKTNVCVCDYVDTKHKLDKNKGDIFGITGYKNKWWGVCDYSNYCIKIFSLGSNVLQRYVRFGSTPHDVTEIIVKHRTTEQDSASCSETAISGTGNKPDRKHLLAVTLPWRHLILIIDLGKNPAVIHNKVKTEKECYSIDFYDGNIYIVCWEPPLVSPWSVSIMSVEGVTLKTFQTDVPLYVLPYITVLNGNIYMTDRRNHRVVCYNDEGRVLHQINIDGSWPAGICVDRSEDKVYVCSLKYDKVYGLESGLSRYKSVLDQTTRYMERPDEMCFYSDKLYISHWSGYHVTVVRLL